MTDSIPQHIRQQQYEQIRAWWENLLREQRISIRLAATKAFLEYGRGILLYRCQLQRLDGGEWIYLNEESAKNAIAHCEPPQLAKHISKLLGSYIASSQAVVVLVVRDADFQFTLANLLFDSPADLN